MAKEFTVTLSGLPETTRRLKDLPTKIQLRAMRKAANAGSQPLLRAARSNAPRATGRFAKTLAVKIKQYRGGSVVVAVIGQEQKNKSLKKLRKGRGGISGRGGLVPIHFVEEDTRPHRIPKEFKKTQLKTTKEYRDRMRALGKEFRVYNVERRAPLMLRLPSGQRVFVEAIHHPGTKGQHPIRRAADSAGPTAVDAFAQKLAQEVDREVINLGAIA